MAKTSSKTTATTDAGLRAELTNLKLAVVNIHTGDENKYVRITVARDACFTSHNALKWKTEQMDDVRDEISGIVNDGGEVSNLNLERKIELFARMESELNELTLRHEADLAVYEAVTEEKWRPGPRTKAKAKPEMKAKLAEILGK